jgi:hypothetical protein
MATETKRGVRMGTMSMVMAIMDIMDMVKDMGKRRRAPKAAVILKRKK